MAQCVPSVEAPAVFLTPLINQGHTEPGRALGRISCHSLRKAVGLRERGRDFQLVGGGGDEGSG